MKEIMAENKNFKSSSGLSSKKVELSGFIVESTSVQPLYDQGTYADSDVTSHCSHGQL